MFSFIRIRHFIFILVFSSCVNITNEKTSVSTNDKFYKIENIDENKNTSTSVGKISNSHKEIINIINKRIFNE